jgi:guanine deaminase
MAVPRTIFGPILTPRANGSVRFIPDGVIHCDRVGSIDYIGAAKDLPPSLDFGEFAWSALSVEDSRAAVSPRTARGIIIPPLLDAHIHIPQHPIRGHFMDGIAANPPEGRLLAGLNRNVFPAEARCADEAITRQIVTDFARDTLSQGVVGGAAYMTVHEGATVAAIEQLHEFWSVGLVLMEMNCPEYLRTDRTRVNDELARDLATRFGRRFIMTDRFAVAVGSDLRQWGARMAGELGLRTQTHLNEQTREKHFVEKTLYPQYASYTDVYYRDGLLDHDAILAHCIHMSDAELALVARSESVVAHCPTSNALLCSGIMPLDRMRAHGVNYAICTDVGASPTTSMLAEMAQFLKVHAGRSDRATPAEALYRATLAPAQILGLTDKLGSLEIGQPMSFIEVAAEGSYTSADDAILTGLLGLSHAELGRGAEGELREPLNLLEHARLDVGDAFDLLDRDVRDTARRLEQKVQAVTLAGSEIWRRDGAKSV